eukprot:SAG31_NODE_8970_length_1355_cov_1.355096_1_plen_73_part_10
MNAAEMFAPLVWLGTLREQDESKFSCVKYSFGANAVSIGTALLNRAPLRLAVDEATSAFKRVTDVATEQNDCV